MRRRCSSYAPIKPLRAPASEDIIVYVPATEPLQVYRSNNIDSDIEALENRCQVPIDNSAFNANPRKVDEDQLHDQAMKVGDVAVLVSSHYKPTEA
jgi:hypothetical protein